MKRQTKIIVQMNHGKSRDKSKNTKGKVQVNLVRRDIFEVPIL